MSEIARVLRHGGYLILLESIVGSGSHMFPRSSEAWQRLAQTYGFELVGKRGVGYDFIFRLINLGLRKINRAFPVIAKGTGSTETKQEDFKRRARRIFRTVLFTIALLPSYPLEHVWEAVMPDTMATHCLMVFRKSKQ